MKKLFMTWFISVFICCLLYSGEMGVVRAEGGSSRFGTSEGYTWNVGESSPIGLYFSSTDEQNLTEVELLITYDPGVLSFDSAEAEGVTVLSEGRLVIRRNGNFGNEFQQLVYFTPLVSTQTQIEISSANGSVPTGNISANEASRALVNIPVAPGCELGGIWVNDEQLENFEPYNMFYGITVPWEVDDLNITAADNGGQVEISDTTLEIGENIIYITTTNGQNQHARYTLFVTREEKVLEKEGVSANNQNEEEAPTDVWNEQDNPDIMDTSESLLKNVGLAILVMVIELGLVLAVMHENKRHKSRPVRPKRKNRQATLSDLPPVVIQAKHICMDFDKKVNEYSSIKELLIRMIKREQMGGKYRALNDISFEIRKGEVVGVIGTNGAGKSTLLKIVTGALIPTSGEIRVNKNKVQLLTLGTGFDMELTGRENIYLNGAIIGYDKEFIDANYDQIVEFAELGDFINEKVKNYSSGMVSRLGFSIATVGNAAEILILDEVLSVGDRIFKQKSLSRIQEMIHGGSTVIMVSHSTGTIKDNCGKAIWIEKGHMIAMGTAKDICEMYEKYDGNLERLLADREKANTEVSGAG